MIEMCRVVDTVLVYQGPPISLVTEMASFCSTSRAVSVSMSIRSIYLLL